MKNKSNFKEDFAFVIVATLLLILALNVTSAQEVPTYQQGQSIQLTAVCDNCTFVNLTSVTFPNGSFALLGQFSMTKNGTNYNFTFSNTNTLGTYKYVTCGDLNGVLTCEDTISREFIITPSGTLFTNALSIPLFLPMVLMMLIALFFFFLTHYIGKDEYKFTFLILGGIFLIFAISFGIIASREVLYGFPLLYGFVNSFYRIFVISLRVGVVVVPVIVMFFIIKRAFSTRGYFVGK